MSKKLELEVYRMGPVRCSICTNIESEAQIEAVLNLKRPTGISSSWGICKKKTFKTGEPNPCPCEQKPKTHKHYLMEC